MAAQVAQGVADVGGDGVSGVGVPEGVEVGVGGREQLGAGVGELGGGDGEVFEVKADCGGGGQCASPQRVHVAAQLLPTDLRRPGGLGGWVAVLAHRDQDGHLAESLEVIVHACAGAPLWPSCWCWW
ncbi:hypothetical protein FEK34_29305 [Nocardia cyriacigeorgica]|uniref:Uncharacterized protein n=1 Tax=Nocardia cyriacigeorgica TaxID=135487 RepID=A0A5R8N9T4_9NOCA|nr:hypothetical protein FEK34_29305 [Nocardia cyriacigeorgica]